ncbi:MAG: FAD-dependent oxidoreductase [Bradymonadales bacterium]|nr:MAG: FAD-dependent oxidoreductase [Bradymonadales bacterium]
MKANIGIIGSGIASCLLAYRLHKLGVSCCLFESRPQLHDGASGSLTANVVPQFTKSSSPLSRSLNECFLEAIEFYARFKNWRPCGAHFLFHSNADREKYQAVQIDPRFKASFLSPEETREVSSFPTQSDSLFVQEAGYVYAKKLCEEILSETDSQQFIRSQVTQIERLPSGSWRLLTQDGGSSTFPIVVLANAFEAMAFTEAAWLPLRQVRGQSVELRSNLESRKLSKLLCFEGSLTPCLTGDRHHLGGTYRHENFHDIPQADETADLLGRLQRHFPSLEGLEPLGSRARVRNTTPDHFPILGAATNREAEPLPGLFFFLGLGSRGFSWGPSLSRILAEEILKTPELELAERDRKLLQVVRPCRFLNDMKDLKALGKQSRVF